jgi:D-alanyl-D-alanine carboxypeptidase/D-alanyl-D-alanine-endopeptidase (penicillin-binding protein 4)
MPLSLPTITGYTPGILQQRSAWLVILSVALTACHATTRVARLSPAAAQPGAPLVRLRQEIDALLGQPALAHGYWGVLVRSVKNDETLYALNKDKLMLPASNMKLVTLAAAAEKLGWDYRFDTRLSIAGAVDEGILRGDLVVGGSGDPSLVAAGGMADTVFADWASRLKQRGIRAISGRVIGDDNGFEEQTLGFGWSWDDLPGDDAAGVGALQYNENAVRVTVTPGPSRGDQAGISVVPAGGGLAVVSSVVTAAAGTPPSIAASRLPGSTRLDLRGAIAAGGPPATLLVSVDNPTAFFVTALRTALIANGIDVRGPAVDVDDIRDAPRPEQLLSVHTYRSAPLSTLAVRLMKDSQNQYAETFFKAIAAAPGVVPTAAAGQRAAQALFEDWGVHADALIQRDGSGLSRYDYVTAESLVTILAHVYRDARLRAPFEASLPIAGRDGTLRNRMKDTAAEGNARAKTGSMTSVRGLSGYVTSADGEPLVFSILANNFDTAPDVVTKTSDAVVVHLAQFRR